MLHLMLWSPIITCFFISIDGIPAAVNDLFDAVCRGVNEDVVGRERCSSHHEIHRSHSFAAEDFTRVHHCCNPHSLLVI